MQISQYNLVSQIISEAVSLLPMPNFTKISFCHCKISFCPNCIAIFLFRVSSGQRQTFPKSLLPVQMAFYVLKMPTFLFVALLETTPPSKISFPVSFADASLQYNSVSRIIFNVVSLWHRRQTFVSLSTDNCRLSTN